MLSLLISLITTMPLAQLPQQGQEICQPIGRMLADNMRPRLVCRQEWVNPLPGKTVNLLCFESQNRVVVEQRQPAAAICEQRPAHNVCRIERLWDCSRVRNLPGVQMATLRPYGLVHRQQRPKLSWQPVPLATHYRVLVRGSWERVTSKPELAFPANEPSLQPGQSYEILLSAFAGERLLATQSLNYHVLPQQELNQVAGILKQLENVDTPEDLALHDFQALFIGFGLWDDALAVLNQQVKQGSLNPSLYRTMGDRYLELGLISQAQKSYAKAIQLSERNIKERLLAQTGLAEAKKFLEPAP